MRTRHATGALILALFGAGLLACDSGGSGDGRTGEPDTTGDTTAPDGTGIGGDAAGDATGDGEGGGPCQPNPCDEKAPSCEDGQRTTYVTPGACSVTDGEAVCDYEIDEQTACGEGELCEEGECVAGCDPNPCTGKQDDCSGGMSTSYVDDSGSCSVENNAVQCDYDVDEQTACGEQEACRSGSCVQTCDVGGDYEFSGHASYMTSIQLPNEDNGGACCFDFGGDNGDRVDNGLGDFITQIAGIAGGSLPEGGVNGLIEENIKDSSIALVFEERELDDATSDEEFTFNGFVGTPAGPSCEPLAEGDFTYEDYASGGGRFFAEPESFGEDGSPQIQFDGASIENGVMEAGPSEFQLTLPLQSQLGFNLTLNIFQTRLEAETAFGPGDESPMGLELHNGRLGGVVPMEQLVDALNNLTETCPCLGIGEDQQMLELESEDTLACTEATNEIASDACADSEEDICGTVAENVGVVCSAIGIVTPDIDTDDSGTPDAFSVGLRFEGTHAAIDGIAPAEDGSGSGGDGSGGDGSGGDGSGGDGSGGDGSGG